MDGPMTHQRLRPGRRAPRRVATLVLAIVATLLLAGPSASAPWTTAKAWIDSPLPLAHVPLAAVELTAHATDPSGVSLVELYVGRSVAASAQPPGTPRLATVNLRWMPAAAGSWWLTLRARGTRGAWGEPTYLLVTVDGDLPRSPEPSASGTEGSQRADASPSAAGSPSPSSPASAPATPRPTSVPTSRPTPVPTPRPTSVPTSRPTPVPTARPTPTPTPRPTPVPCTPPAPDLLGPNGTITDPALNPPTVRWDYRTAPSCAPSGFRVQIANDRSFTSIVYDVTLGGAARGYTPPAPLPDCSSYSWRVIPLRSDGASGTVSTVFTFTLQIGRCA